MAKRKDGMRQTIEQRIATILNNEYSSAAEVAEIVREAGASVAIDP
jgi:hypothetical protein